jgi:hypothetical protein
MEVDDLETRPVPGPRPIQQLSQDVVNKIAAAEVQIVFPTPFHLSAHWKQLFLGCNIDHTQAFQCHQGIAGKLA